MARKLQIQNANLEIHNFILIPSTTKGENKVGVTLSLGDIPQVTCTAQIKSHFLFSHLLMPFITPLSSPINWLNQKTEDKSKSQWERNL